ncbi:nitroreductase family protein [Aspergillus undulatus]|uniref:nitroreductase family protein n=1 Tax=Aspergillus undulatus TaxID=1810928 RepID=UPI003CCC953F
MAASRISPRLLSLLPSFCLDALRGFYPSLGRIVRPFSYSAGKQSPKTDTLVELATRALFRTQKIEELANAAILHVPSSFNTQLTRLLVLLHRERERLWETVIDTFQNLVKTGALSKEVWGKQTLPKLQGFQAGVGTILFYEDPAHIKPFSEKFALYKGQFQPWAEHSNAMHQYFLWSGLEYLGFGANLQHYNPLIDAPVAKQWEIPSEWRLIAQLVFGSPEGKPGDKSYKPIEERVKIYGKQ